MSNQLRNWMCEEGVEGDHCDPEAMDWAVEKINHLTSQLNAHVTGNNLIVEKVKSITAERDAAIARAEKAEAERDDWRRKEEISSRLAQKYAAKDIETCALATKLQAIVDRFKKARDRLHETSRMGFAGLPIGGKSGGEIKEYDDAMEALCEAALAAKGGGQ